MCFLFLARWIHSNRFLSIIGLTVNFRKQMKQRCLFLSPNFAHLNGACGLHVLLWATIYTCTPQLWITSHIKKCLWNYLLLFQDQNSEQGNQKMDNSQNMSHQAGQAMGQAKVSLALVPCLQYTHFLTTSSIIVAWQKLMLLMI